MKRWCFCVVSMMMNAHGKAEGKVRNIILSKFNENKYQQINIYGQLFSIKNTKI